jgi:hypothetical protein
MNKKEIALQLTLKSLEKFRFDKASQVAEIYNIIYETLRYPEQEDEQISDPEKATEQQSKQPKEQSAEQPKAQVSGRSEAEASGERKDKSSKKSGKAAGEESKSSSEGKKQQDLHDAADPEELTHKLGDALKKSEEQSTAS